MFTAINTIDNMIDRASQVKAIATEATDTLASLAEHIDWEALGRQIVYTIALVWFMVYFLGQAIAEYYRQADWGKFTPALQEGLSSESHGFILVVARVCARVSARAIDGMRWMLISNVPTWEASIVRNDALASSLSLVQRSGLARVCDDEV
jgi:hypothetical protein